MHRKAITQGLLAQVQDYAAHVNHDVDMVFTFPTGAGKTVLWPVAPPSRETVRPFSREAPRYLNVREIEALIGKSKATIYRWIRLGRFPEPWVRGEGSTLWHSSQFLDWSDAKHNGKK